MRIIEKDELYDAVKNQNKEKLYNLLNVSNDTGVFYPNDNYSYETLLHINASVEKNIFNKECLDILCVYSTGYINLKDSHNRTPLLLACMNNNLDAIIILLSYGADFTLIDSYGRKAFDYITNPAILNKIEEYFIYPFSKRGEEIKGIPYWLDEFKYFVFSNEKEELNFLLNLLLNRTKDIKEFLRILEDLNIKIYTIVDNSNKVKDLKFIKQNKEFFLSKLNSNFMPQKFIQKMGINYYNTLSVLLTQNYKNDGIMRKIVIESDEKKKD